MSEGSPDFVNLQTACSTCGSTDTELRRTGSCFPGSAARYIRCGSCRAENFLDDGIISHVTNINRQLLHNAKPLSTASSATFSDNSERPVELRYSHNSSLPRDEMADDEYDTFNRQAAKSVDSSVMSFNMSYNVSATEPFSNDNFSPNKRQRSRCSSTNIHSDHDKNVGNKRSVSLNDVAENLFDADAMDELVRQLYEGLRHHPCDLCGRVNWKGVEGIDKVLCCGYCGDVVGFDILHNLFDLLPFLEKGEFRVKPCRFDDCSNDDAAKFTLQRASSGEAILKCTSCGRLQEKTNEDGWDKRNEDDCEKKDDDDCEKRDAENKRPLGDGDGVCGGTGRNCGRTEITNLRPLRRGDHIAWHQSLSYWHHALVQEVAQGWLKVIHYNGPLSTKIKGIIMEEWVEMDDEYFRANKLYRLNYDPKDCLPPDEVLQRARSRLDETSYSLLGNNCEHFATWCKTGRKFSSQVETFTDTVQRHSNNWSLANYLTSSTRGFVAKAVGRSNQVKGAVKYGSKAVNIGVNLTSAGSDVGKAAGQVAVKEVKHVASALSCLEAGILVVLEVGAVFRDIHRAHEQRVAGEITRKEFLRVTIKRTSEGVGCAAGAAVVLALPLPAKWIGCTLATLIGQGAGALAGKKLADLVV